MLNIVRNIRWALEDHMPFEQETEYLWQRVKANTMTSIARIDVLRNAIEYILLNNVPGDFVECGVWKGGSMQAMALALIRWQRCERKLWLYDTFNGMTDPTEEDLDYNDRPATDGIGDVECVDIDAVRKVMEGTGYPRSNVIYVAGPVELTLKCAGGVPDKIALLRLDTDFYRSTKVEMNELWPQLVAGGILIVDDYGYWKGARKAVDEYFRDNDLHPYMQRIDDSGAVAMVKQ